MKANTRRYLGLFILVLVLFSPMQIFSKNIDEGHENWLLFQDRNRKRSKKELKLIKAARANASNEELIVHYAIRNGMFAWYSCHVRLYICCHMCVSHVIYVCVNIYLF